MKNHLSMELSIFSAGISSLAGRGGSWSGDTREGDCWTVTLVLGDGQYECGCDMLRVLT